MIIIDNIKDKPPIFVRKEIPTFKTTYDREKYYDREKSRWQQ